MNLEELSDGVLKEWFEDAVECHLCDEDQYKSLERVDMIYDGYGRKYFKISYECGHQRLIPLITW